MKVKLKSDFMDFYDLWFDREAEYTLQRLTKSGMSRDQMFKFLTEHNVPTVQYGTPQELKSNGFQGRVVVYTDLNAHRGDGKLLMTVNDALLSMPNYLCSRYSSTVPGLSIRHLQLGEYWFKLRYTSVDDWRSNCGSDVDILLLDVGIGYHSTIRAPVFAIDFVQANDGLLAVDYNIAPGCAYTGIEQFVKPKEIADSIKKTIEMNLAEGKLIGVTKS